jgi:osmoprotectant transport system permease protein
MYPEYTGTGLLVILQPPAAVVNLVENSKEKTYNYVKKEFEKRYGIKWLQPIGFNNAYALMMRQKQAADLNVKSITDLKNYLDKK